MRRIRRDPHEWHRWSPADGRTNLTHSFTETETIHPPSRRWGLHSRRLPIPLPAPTPPHHPPQPRRHPRFRQLDHLMLVSSPRRHPPQRVPNRPRLATPTQTLLPTRPTRSTLTTHAKPTARRDALLRSNLGEASPDRTRCRPYFRAVATPSSPRTDRPADRLHQGEVRPRKPVWPRPGTGTRRQEAPAVPAGRPAWCPV